MPIETLRSRGLFRKAYFLGLMLIALSVTVAFFWPRVSETREPSLRIGVSRNPAWALIYIAAAENFFEKAGVTVELRDYPSSRQATDGLLAGEVDIAIAMDTSIALEISRKQPIVVIAQDHSSPHLTGILARVDRGIYDPDDFVGKRIGYQTGTSAEAFLRRFLTLERISLSQVTLVPLPISEVPAALAADKIDAAAIWQPWIARAQKKLPPGSSKVFYNEIVGETGGLITRRDVIQNNRIGVERTLLGLGMAFDLYLNDRDKAFFVMQRALGMDVDFETAWEVWSHLSIDLSLGHYLLWSISQEIVWLNREQHREEMNVDIAPYVDASLLRSVRPDLVLLY